MNLDSANPLDRIDQIVDEAVTRHGQENRSVNGHAALANPVSCREMAKMLPLPLASLEGQEPPPRRFAWEPWIPAGTVTLLHGFGGVGKSLLDQQIATAYALGVPLFGGATEGRSALVVAGEDSHDELWRRQIDICHRYGCKLSDLADKLHLLPAPHLDLTLAEASENGSVTPTDNLDILKRQIEAQQAGLVVLDNSAKLFAIKEADRIAVTRCLNLLQGICHECGTSILLVAHNNKLGDFSGSTAWENACRSRLSLTRDEDAETLTLARPKANYAALGEVKIQWDNGSFRCDDEAGMSFAERLDAEQEKRRHATIFLNAIDVLTTQRRTISHNKRATNYAPKAITDANLASGLTANQLADAMELLFAENRIVGDAKVYERQNRSWASGIVRVGNGVHSG